MCVCDTVGCIVCVSVCEWEDERSHSYYIKQDFPEQSAPATELPKSSSGFPLQQKVGGLAESALFVLEHHCSGGAEAMSQHWRHSAHLPRNAQLLNVRLLLCHLAFPHGIYSGRNHSCYWPKESRLLLALSFPALLARATVAPTARLSTRRCTVPLLASLHCVWCEHTQKMLFI